MWMRSYFSPEIFVRPSWPDSRHGELLATLSQQSALMVEPRLEPRDEAIFWLTAAAEIEHFLMVHYLFAAYSLDPEAAGGQATTVRALQRTLLQIAREEMGHLITVQNLLTLVGGPHHFGREHSPHASQIYPFRFRLEKASADSLAKYALAESPIDRTVLEAGLSSSDLEIYDMQIVKRAEKSNDGLPVRHVGPLFARLRQLFADELGDADFRLNRASRQAQWSDWGYKPNPADGVDTDLKVLVHSFVQADVEAARQAAVDAIQEIGDQGEEADIDIGNGESHFERFFAAYKDFANVEQVLGREPVRPIAANPNAAVASPSHDDGEDGTDGSRISDPRTRRWAQLFNLRYRLLLRFLAHALQLDGPVFVDEGPALGDRTPKGMMSYWTFKEMRRLKKIAGKLVQLPLGDNSPGLNAGPPFELPYRLDLAVDETDRWEGHADVLRASAQLARHMQEDPTDAGDPFVAHLAKDDLTSAEIAELLGAGQALPETQASNGFRKVVEILDESVRGFPVGGFHADFWRDTTLPDFLQNPPMPVNPGDPDGSLLIQRIEVPEDDPGRMPRYRPRIDQTRIDFIRDWIVRGAPDSTPTGEIGITTEPDPLPE